MSRDSGTGRTTRRDWLGVLGAGSAALLAGCSGDSGGDGAQGGGTFYSSTWAQPSQAQFSQYNPSNQTEFPNFVIFGWLARYAQDSDEWVPHLAEDWNFSGTALTLNIDDSFVWHNGDPVTAEDVERKLRVEYAMGTRVADFLAGVEVPDETTVEIELQSETNEDLLYQNLLTLMVDTPESVWEEFVSDVSYDDGDYSSVQEEIVQFSWDEPIGWGPFQYDDRTGQQLQVAKFDDHPNADQINWDTIAYRFVENKQGKMQGFLSERIDGGGMIPTEEVYDQLPDKFVEWKYNRGLGFALHFNQNNEDLQDVRVRKALSHVLERESMVANQSVVGPSQLEYDTGFHGNEEVQRQYLGDDLDQFTLYDDTQQATALLEDAGYSREDGQWMKPNGDPFQLTLRAASGFSAWRVGTNEATRQLSEFGIDAEFEQEQVSTYLSNTLPNGDFDIGASFVGEQILHPVTDLKSAFYGYESFSPDIGTPEEVSVPMPVGDESGSEETVNIRDLIAQISSTSGEESANLIKQLSWAYNQTMPTYAVFTSYGFQFLNSEKWSSPDDAVTSEVSYPLEFMIAKGQIQAK